MRLDAAFPRAYIEAMDEKAGGRPEARMRFGNFDKINLVTMALVGALAGALAGGLAPTPGFSTDWQRAGEGRVQSAYPYSDLPGVKAPTDKSLEPKYTCRTETQYVRRRYDEIFRSGGMPMTVYVCDHDGVISSGSAVPRRGHYQPVR